MRLDVRICLHYVFSKVLLVRFSSRLIARRTDSFQSQLLAKMYGILLPSHIYNYGKDITLK